MVRQIDEISIRELPELKKKKEKENIWSIVLLNARETSVLRTQSSVTFKENYFSFVTKSIRFHVQNTTIIKYRTLAQNTNTRLASNSAISTFLSWIRKLEAIGAQQRQPG